MKNIYFLGGGNMSTAIVTGLLKDAQFRICVIERTASRRSYLENTYGINTLSSVPTLSEQDILVLAVKPQDMQAACRDVVCQGALVLSIAAGLAVETLSAWLGNHQRIVRIMPNLPAQVASGVSGIYAPNHISDKDYALTEYIMKQVGSVIRLNSEEQIHAITAIAGSGPGYVFYLMDALFQAALKQGFDELNAHQLVLKTFQGASLLAENRKAPFAQLQAEVTSKGGTTAAALEQFNQANLMQIMQQAVDACAERSIELGQALSEQ